MRRSCYFRLGVAGVLAVAGLCATGTAARADEQGDLDKARAAYLARRYDEAERRFRTMLDPVNGTIHDPTLLSRARMYWGAVALAKSSAVQATAIFEKLLLDDPTFEPDPLSFPADVINAFIDTRARMRERLSAMAAEQARREAERRAREDADRKRQAGHLALVERLASEEEVTDRHSRWVSLLPFGVGQFQNGKNALGWFFLGSEAALVAGGCIALPFYTYNATQGIDAYEHVQTSRASDYFDRANIARAMNIVLLSSAAGVGVLGVVQAQLAYVPDVVTIKHRVIPDARATSSRLPAPPWLLPSVSPILAPGHGAVGGQASVTFAF